MNHAWPPGHVVSDFQYITKHEKLFEPICVIKKIGTNTVFKIKWEGALFHHLMALY